MRTEFVRGGELPPVRLTRAVKRGEGGGGGGGGRGGGGGGREGWFRLSALPTVSCLRCVAAIQLQLYVRDSLW